MTPPGSGSAERELQIALQAYRRGDLRTSEITVDKVLGSHPDRADAKLAKGMILMAQGDQPRALEFLLDALKIEPESAEALNWATFLSLNLRLFEQAEALARRFAQAQPRSHRAHYLLASALRARDQVEDALVEIDKALVLKPEDLDSLVTKARLLKTAQLPGLAIETYRRVLAVQPFPPAAVDMAEMLLLGSHPEEALNLLEQASRQLSEADRPYGAMAQALTELQRFEEADRQWSLAARFAGNETSVTLRRAKAEISVGLFGPAEARLDATIAKGLQVESCFAVLTTARKMTPADQPLIERMEEILGSGELNPSGAAQLNYALGKSLDDLGEYQRAIGHFDEANRLSYELSPHRRAFSPEGVRSFTDFQIDYFTQDRIRSLTSRALDSELPLFVVGMMRSGTTLTEHILSAHSRIKGGGEQAFWTERAAEYIDVRRSSFEHGLALRLAKEYLALVDPKRGEIARVVDKNPGNTVLSAMLYCLFPNAKFVHIKRHPVDNLLSMWMTPVSGDVAYTCNRDNLVFTYREYLRLLAHFTQVLPPDRFRTFRYEDITSTPHETIAAMFDHIGFAPEPACFTPESNSRAVLTPSVFQVRQPIHRGSQARWRHYEPWLGPFGELLDPHAL